MERAGGLLGGGLVTQSNDLYRAPTESVQNSATRGTHIGARALIVIELIRLAISLAYPSGEEGDLLLV
jgi:hypothetical protein